MLALQFSDSISNNKQFLGFNVNPSPVLYISTENAGNQLKERTELMNIKFEDNKFMFIDRQEYGSFNIRDMEIDFKYFSEQLGGKLVIIDMIKDIEFDIDYDINNYQDINHKVLDKLRGLCDKYNFSILFIHHLNKKGRSLGSTAFDGSVDGILKLTQSQTDKRRYTLSIINRDYPCLELSLIKEDNCILNITEEEDYELDYNLIELIRYCAKEGETDFTCTDVINKLGLKTTAKRLGRLITSNLDLLAKEGLYVTKSRSSDKRMKHAKYEEPIDEND